MSEMAITVPARTRADEIGKDMVIMLMSRENERLNEELRLMRAKLARDQLEAKALRVELQKTRARAEDAEARARDARARNMRLYRERGAEAERVREGGPVRRWKGIVLALMGVLAGLVIAVEIVAR